MELDKEIKRTLINDTKDYLKKHKIHYRYITVRGDMPVVVVDYDTFVNLLSGTADGGRIIGRFIAQTDNGWSAYISEDEYSNYRFCEKLTEYQATCFVIGQQFGRKPKMSRFAGGVA